MNLLHLLGARRSSTKRGASEPVQVIGADEPVYTGSNLVFAGDATDEHYATVAAAGANPLGTTKRFAPYPSQVVDGEAGGPLDTERSLYGETPFAGGKAVVNFYPTSASQHGPAWVVLNGGDHLATKTHYFRGYITAAGTCTGTISVKWAQVALTGEGGGAYPQWNTHDLAPYTGTITGDPHTIWQVYNNGYEDNVGDYPTGDDQGCQPIGPFFEDLFNSWHRFTFAYKCHESAGNKNGFQRMWIDGTKVIDVSAATAGVTPTGGSKQWCTQAQVDNMHVNKVVDPVTSLWLGRTVTTLSQPAWFQAINIGDGDATNLQTFAWWTD